MIDPVFFISEICVVTAIVFGLLSRNFTTAVVAGLILGLIHVGLLALIGAQKGAFEFAELPYLKDGIDMAMATGKLTFANARLDIYLAALALGTMIVMVAAYLLRWIVLSILGLTPVQRRAA